MFSIYASEKDCLWERLAENPADQVLQLLENNPFGKLNEMDIDERFTYVPIERERVLAEMMKPLGEEGLVSISLGTTTPFDIEGVFSRASTSNGMFVRTNSEDLNRVKDMSEVQTYLQKWRFVLPKFFSSGASADNRDNGFWIDVAQTEPLPECFGSRLGWYHVISPLGYRDYFKREDLLKAPAHKIEELNDGTITILSYDNPLDFETPETTEKIIKITNYLNAKRKD